MSDHQIGGLRVTLVPLRAGHAEELAGLLDDDSLREMVGVGDLDGLRRRFAGWESRRSPDGSEQWLNWAVHRRGDGAALGWVQATVRGSTATVAYAVLPNERGRGAASDSVRAMIAWLRAELGVAAVTATIDPGNTASAHVARAVGLTPTANRNHGEIVWVDREGGVDRRAGQARRS